MSAPVAILLDELPPYKGNQRMVASRQDTFDIIREIMKMHNRTAPHYDRIALMHWAGSEAATAKHLFDFCRAHMPYKVERTYKQTVKTPAAILEERLTFGNDCKHYASYIVGIGAALNRMGYPIKCFYRFGSYRDRQGKVSRNPGHVFAVFVIGGREIWIDPVPEIGGFDSRKICPVRIIDKMPPMKDHNSIGSLYEISGVGEEGDATGRLHFRGHGQRAHRPSMVRHWLDEYNHGLHNKPMMTPAASPGIKAHSDQAIHGAHWLDELPVGDIDEMGKLKIRMPKIKVKAPHIKIKAPHIKIQPGKLLKKIAAAPARNAYLLLLKLNLFNMAVRLHNKMKQDPKAWGKLHDFWKSVGGNPNKFRTAISNGVSTHNKMHPRSKVSGPDYDFMSGGFTNDYVSGTDDEAFIHGADEHITGYDYYTEVNGVGVVQAVGAAAIIAAAAPIIKAISNVLKSLGVKHDDVDAGRQSADVDAAAEHNQATDTKGDGKADLNPDGSVDHGNGVTSTVTTDGQGNQTVTYKVKDPTTSGGQSEESEPEEDTDGGHTVTKTKVVTKTKTKTTDGDIEGSGGSSFSDMWGNVKNFVSDHKWWFIGGTLALTAVIVIPKIFHHGPKRRR